MSQKIPSDYNDAIYDKYENYLALGVPITQIATLVNEELGTDFPESSLRGRYEKEKMRVGLTPIEDDETYQKRLLSLAKEQIRLKHEQKILVKERSIIDGMMREATDKSAVAEAIRQIWENEPVHKEFAKGKVMGRERFMHGYSYGDVHDGYRCDLEQNIYNPTVTEQRITAMFDYIIDDIKRCGYKEVFISDHGDDIEGAGLRISQLLRISEEMTKQARHYANLITEQIKWVSAELPEVEITFIMISSDNHSELRLYNTKRGDMDENLQLLITNHVQAVVDTAHEYGGMKNLTYIQGDEVLMHFDKVPVVFAHGHQYSSQENILEKVEHRHGCHVNAYIAGHWHRFSVKHRNVKNGMQQALIHLPSIVGDTDYSDTLFVSALPGFAKVKIDLDTGMVNAKAIGL